jgi:hypothetical protein
MVRYYGLYANAHRGKVGKADRVPVALGMIEEEPPRVPSKGWAEMIRKVYEVDPMICPRFGLYSWRCVSGSMSAAEESVDYE